MFVMKLIKNRRGDTIVEVLVAVAVVGFMLSISYRLANRSLQASRSAQERSEALKLAEQQLERLKAVASKAPNADLDVYATAGKSFCISINGSNQLTNKGLTNPLFTITIRWGNLAGGNNEVKMYYRIQG
jgi:type II secretory pathway pseudopilin PulG